MAAAVVSALILAVVPIVVVAAIVAAILAVIAAVVEWATAYGHRPCLQTPDWSLETGSGSLRSRPPLVRRLPLLS